MGKQYWFDSKESVDLVQESTALNPTSRTVETCARSDGADTPCAAPSPCDNGSDPTLWPSLSDYPQYRS